MKSRFSLIFLSLFLLFSCSEDDNNSNDDPQIDPIIGEWELNYKHRIWSNDVIYNPGDVIYKFNVNGTLDIISSIPEVDSETLTYELVFDCLRDPECVTGLHSPQDVLILSNSTRNNFLIVENELSFGLGYADGWQFQLERLP